MEISSKLRGVHAGTELFFLLRGVVSFISSSSGGESVNDPAMKSAVLQEYLCELAS